MPYIDGDCQYVDDHGDYFEIVGSGDYSATETRGYIYSRARYTCDNCGDGMLAFTENPTKGQLDLQLKLSVSKYLARYCDWMPGDKISAIAGKFAADTYTLTIEQTKEAFIFAYEGQEVMSESSLHVSCMAKTTDSYGTPVHPAAVYYTGSRSDSLSIAYIRDPHNPNKVLARALVWPDKETFVRLYGTSETMRITLREKLEAAGFTRDDDFSGARLRRIEMNGGSRFVMPYIDGDCQYVDDHGDYFEIVGSGDYSATETRGYIYSRMMCRVLHGVNTAMRTARSSVNVLRRHTQATMTATKSSPWYGTGTMTRTVSV